MARHRESPAKHTYADPSPGRGPEKARLLAAWAVLTIVVLAFLLLSIGLLAAVLF